MDILFTQGIRRASIVTVIAYQAPRRIGRLVSRKLRTSANRVCCTSTRIGDDDSIVATVSEQMRICQFLDCKIVLHPRILSTSTVQGRPR